MSGRSSGREVERSRTLVRPTVFGLAVAVVLLAAGVLRPAVADPSVTGLVWAGLLGALLLGMVWPIVTVRLVKVRIVAAPQDLVVGQLSSLELELSTRASGLAIGCTGSGTSIVDVVSPGATRIPVTISARGAYRWIQIDVGSDAPFGIMWANRTRLVALPRQLLVGPESARESVALSELPGDLQDPSPSGHGSSGEAVRSVRPYVTGDPSHLVHWPSTARVGSLVVRELEPPATRGLAVVVDLTPLDPPDVPSEHTARGDVTTHFGGEGTGDPVEVAASRAAGIAESALDSGARVLLCTVESSGPVSAEVADLLDVRRRLALAVEGTPSSPPDDWPTVRIVAGLVAASAADPVTSSAPNVPSGHTPRGADTAHSPAEAGRHLPPIRRDGAGSETDLGAGEGGT